MTTALPIESNMPRFIELVRSFPSLHAVADAIEAAPTPHTILTLSHDDAYETGKHGAGAQHAWRFVMRLYFGPYAASGSFDPLRAMAHWDSRHRAAFAGWAANPFWP
jgi:hypothetical protein